MHFFLPTCHVKVGRFYHNSFSLSFFFFSFSSFSFSFSSSPILFAKCLFNPPRQASRQSSRQVSRQPSSPSVPIRFAKCHANPLRQLRIAVCSVHRWTSSAKIRSQRQCALLDLIRQGPIAVCTAGPQPPPRMPKYMSENLPEYMLDRLTDRLSEYTNAT